MATITATAKSGSVGPSIFATSTRYGTTERQRVTGCNPRSPAQRNHRTFILVVTCSWGERSEAQRAGWQALGRQLPGHPSGYAAYVSANVTRLHGGQPPLDVAPSTPALGTLTCAGLVVEETPLVKLSGLSATFAPDQFIIEACAPVSAGVDYVKRSFRQLLTVAGYAAPAADLDLTGAYVKHFGALQAGDKVFVRLRPVKDGFKGAPVQCVAIVPARGLRGAEANRRGILSS